jgi:hypothetical protein
MDANVFLLINLALSFYLVGAIWAQEVECRDFCAAGLASSERQESEQVLHKIVRSQLARGLSPTVIAAC